MGSELGNGDGHYSGGEGDLSDKKKIQPCEQLEIGQPRKRGQQRS